MAGLATASLIGLLTWLAGVLAAGMLARAGHRGPAELLVRRLTYCWSPPFRARTPHSAIPPPPPAAAIIHSPAATPPPPPPPPLPSPPPSFPPFPPT